MKLAHLLQTSFHFLLRVALNQARLEVNRPGFHYHTKTHKTKSTNPASPENRLTFEGVFLVTSVRT